MNNAKQLLDTVRMLYRQYLLHMARVNLMRGNASGPRTARMDGTSGSRNAGRADLSGRVARIVDAQREFGALEHRMKTLRRQAKAMIDRDVFDSGQRRVLTMYYLEGKNLAEIQQALGCSYLQCMRLHDRGIRHLRMLDTDGEGGE